MRATFQTAQPDSPVDAPAFPNGAPVVVATPAFGTPDYIAFIATPTTTGALVFAARRDGTSVTATVPVHWVAIG